VNVLARLQTIPPELYDAARVDGASAVRQFFHVTLPQLRNVLLIVLLLRGIWMFTKFDVPWLLGFGGGADVQTGEYAALPHGSAKPQVIREGTILLMDGGCSVEGYRSDLSRTFVLGMPTQRMRDVFEIVHRAQETAVKTARPGLPCEAVDAAARKVISDAGFGPDYKYFGHRVGHGIGMDGHEWPYLVRGNTLPLAPGMTFSDEPGIYIPGEFGVRLEDDMLITETGAELLSPTSPSLETPFATG